MPEPSHGKRATRPRPALTPDDFERYLTTSSALIAPADVTSLVARAAAIREHLAKDRAEHPNLAQRARIALHLLADHARGECPQIPYQTVSLLATALFYYLTPVDVIPDFIPHVGKSDDAVMLDIAWRLAGPGVQRYIDWKGLAVALRDSDLKVAAIPMPSPGARGRSRSAKPKRPAGRPRTARGSRRTRR
jgi:uncharacterized membrane protein YkvA (DUF1232 family)